MQIAQECSVPSFVSGMLAILFVHDVRARMPPWPRRTPADATEFDVPAEGLLDVLRDMDDPSLFDSANPAAMTPQRLHPSGKEGAESECTVPRDALFDGVTCGREACRTLLDEAAEGSVTNEYMETVADC